jgi:hypothetical protein
LCPSQHCLEKLGEKSYSLAAAEEGILKLESQLAALQLQRPTMTNIYIESNEEKVRAKPVTV